MTNENNMIHKDIPTGEVSGSFLLGLISSFTYLNILPNDLNIGNFEAEEWYPYSLFIDILNNIKKSVPSSDIIFFYAGINFLNIWYEQGPGKTMIHSGLDWLHANDFSGGYNSVVRGGTPDEIGWCKMKSVDLEAGIAIYENVMPLLPEYIKGLFYSGCLLFNDMEYVEVDAISEPYEKNPLFIKTILTVKFHLKSEVSKNLDININNSSSFGSLLLNSEEIETLLWRNKGLEVKNKLESNYHNAIGTLLADSITIIKQKAQALEKLNEEVEYLANYDLLTGLPTRRLVMDKLKIICSEQGRNKIKYAVLFLDLDGFKAVNDTYGHKAGDFVLKTVSKRLNKCLRQEDTVARLGGDEFLLLIGNIKSKYDVTIIAQKIIDVVSEVIEYNNDLITIGASVGICISPDDGKSHLELLNKADKAMYDVKILGKNNFAFYEGSSQSKKL